MMEPVLVGQGLAHAFGERLVFRDVDMGVALGDVVLVVGPNGAGKSTLLGVLSGLVEPVAGTVDRWVEAHQMAMMGHATFVYSQLSALENLRFWAKVYGKDARIASLEEVLQRVGLAAVALEPAGTFSRGMAQRLSLARILVLEPRLVFLDEPATGLDAASVAILHQEIRALAASGAGVVWVSHDVARDISLATQVLHMNGGGVAFWGQAKDFDVETVCSAQSSPL